LFRISLVRPEPGLIFGLRANSYPKPNDCMCKLGPRPKFLLTTRSDPFTEVTQSLMFIAAYQRIGRSAAVWLPRYPALPALELCSASCPVVQVLQGTAPLFTLFKKIRAWVLLCSCIWGKSRSNTMKIDYQYLQQQTSRHSLIMRRRFEKFA